MRLALLEPRGDFRPDVVLDALGLVMEEPPALERIKTWTRLELALAYDWAMREHLAAAGNLTRRRERPSFVVSA